MNLQDAPPRMAPGSWGGSYFRLVLDYWRNNPHQWWWAKFFILLCVPPILVIMCRRSMKVKRIVSSVFRLDKVKRRSPNDLESGGKGKASLTAWAEWVTGL